jgi:hypothetical protein
MISFNNKPASDAVPLFAPGIYDVVVAPGFAAFNPLITSLTNSPLRAPLRSAEAQLRVGLGSYCPQYHPTRFEPSLLE